MVGISLGQIDWRTRVPWFRQVQMRFLHSKVLYSSFASTFLSLLALSSQRSELACDGASRRGRSLCRRETLPTVRHVSRRTGWMTRLRGQSSPVWLLGWCGGCRRARSSAGDARFERADSRLEERGRGGEPRRQATHIHAGLEVADEHRHHASHSPDAVSRLVNSQRDSCS